MKKVKNIIISHSSLGDYHSCPRLWAWNRLGGLVPVEVPDETSGPAFMGTLVHEAIDMAWTGGDWRARVAELVPPGSALLEKPGDKAGSLDHTIELIERYLDFYDVPNEYDYELISSEQVLSIQLTERITFSGRVDKIFKRKSDGKIVVVDHKTSKALSSWVIPLIPSNDQFTAYIAAAQANGIETSDFLVDGISTAKKYLKSPYECFIRVSTTRSQADIDEWKTHVIHDANRLIHDIEHGSFSTGGRKNCLSFGGCAFLDVCNSPASQRLTILNNSYKRLDSPWALSKVTYK